MLGKRNDVLQEQCHVNFAVSFKNPERTPRFSKSD